MDDQRKPLTVAYLTAGGAGMFCGSCMRDNTLAAALLKLDCDPWLIPLYTPIRTDEANVSIDRVFFGGVNVYLQQRFWLFRKLPAFLDGWLDAPWLLRRVAGGNIDVRASELGELTLSMLRGEHGRQRKEVRRLVAWIKAEVKPQLVNLSNVLIAGCVPALRRELKAPILVTLQGDDLFLDDLPASHRDRAMVEVRKLARAVDGFITFSEYYADFMAEYLDVPRDRFHLAPMGLASDDLPGARIASSAAAQQSIGYFARVCPAKGFHLLVDAWLQLRSRPGVERVQLRAAGWLGHSDQAYFDGEVAKIRNAGAEADFHYAGVLDRSEKFEFLQNLSLFSVPTTYREPKGIYVLESLANGVPVVQPDHGAFPELLRATGGGRLVPPGDVAQLANVLHELLVNETARRELGEAGRRVVLRDFTAERMARRTLDVFHQFAGIAEGATTDRRPAALPTDPRFTTRTLG